MPSQTTIKRPLTLDPTLDATLEQLADAANISTGEVLRRGLYLYVIAQEAKAEGRKLGLMDKAEHFEEISEP